MLPAKEEFECYIDESGDEGIGSKCPPWFVLSAVIVKAKDEPKVRCIVDEVKESLWICKKKAPPKQVHWCSLDHNKRLPYSVLLNQKEYCQIAVLAWKCKIPQESKLNDPTWLFRYCCRFLLERISWYVDGLHGHVRITFSNRRRFQESELKDYIHLIRHNPDSQIRNVFETDKIKVRNFDSIYMLKVADATASALGNCLNPDEYGNLNYFYFNNLYSHLYHYKNNGKLWSYGLKVLPSTIKVEEMCANFPFMKDWQ